jgi:hypothetical protein
VDWSFIALVEAELEDLGVSISSSSISSCSAALATDKNLLLNGGTRTQRYALARALGAAATSHGWCNGVVELRVAQLLESQAWGWGRGIAEDAALASLWLVIDAVDVWPFARTSLFSDTSRPSSSNTTRVIAMAAGRRRQPLDDRWRERRASFAWVDVSK